MWAYRPTSIRHPERNEVESKDLKDGYIGGMWAYRPTSIRHPERSNAKSKDLKDGSTALGMT